MRVTAIPILSFLVLLGGCASSPAATPRSRSIGAADTTLVAGDTFEVRVYGEKELSGNYRVAQDGTIDFPLVGRVEVEGKEATEVADEIRNRLRDGQILRDPQVSVLVSSFASKRISVMGAVSKPGSFPMTSGLTLVEAISLAGGFTPLASENDTLVTRRRDGKLHRFRVPAKQVTEGRADDFALQAGDIIYVPERLF
jgi:protein involved in polysaccharide export with SLBB domain